MSLEMPNRRWFFRLLARDGLAAADEFRGRPQIRLTELAGWPDQALTGLVPTVLPGVRVFRDASGVKAQHAEDTAPVLLCEGDEASVLILAQFDGQNSLACIARRLALALGWERSRAFAFTRGFFLRLVKLRVCVPANPPDESCLINLRGAPASDTRVSGEG